MKRIMVTGSGGVAGVNFVRSIRVAREKIFIVGTDYYPYHLEWSDLDVKYCTPRHDDPSFITRIREVATKEKIQFIHPQPELEAYILALNRDKIPCKTFLPSNEAFELGQDKFRTIEACKKANVPVPHSIIIKDENHCKEAFEAIGKIPIWVRARKGAGGRFSLKSNTINEALLWMKLWVTKGLAKWSDFIIEEFLPGRNIAWDSLWFNGKLITSFARERLEYIYPSLAPSGITGTPTVARIIHDKKVNEISEASVRALDKKPHGFFCVDLKENDLGVPCVTEVNVGKFHTTGSLWSYAAIKGLRLPWFYNLSYLYVQIAFQGDVPKENIQQCDIYPEGVYLLRHIDCGAWLYRDDGWKVKIL